MAPKKKGGKKGKKGDDSEPPHEPSWERAVDSGVWEKPVTDLPDANTWPTWGALRERVIMACKEIRVLNTASLRDAFCNEIVKLSPPNLASINFTGSSNLRSFVVSPMTSCPSLSAIDLSECNSLEYVMVQSQSAQTLQIKGCQNLSKVLIHCPHLTTLIIMDNPKLATVMIWSDALAELNMAGCTGMTHLKLQCPNLTETKIPPLVAIDEHIKPTHPPLSFILKDMYTEVMKRTNDARELEWKSLKDDSMIPKVYR